MNILQQAAALVILMLATMGMTSSPAIKQVGDDQLAGLQSALEALREVTVKRDVEGIVSFFHPGMFSAFSKPEMTKMLKQAYIMDGGMKITSMTYENIMPLQPYSDGQFTVLDYVRQFEVPRPGDVTPDIDRIMKELIKKRLGADANIKLDLEKDVVMVNKRSRLFAVSVGSMGWKFMEQKALDLLIQSRQLPDDLIDKLK